MNRVINEFILRIIRMTVYDRYKSESEYTYDNYSLKIHGVDIRDRYTDLVTLNKSQISEFETIFESLKGEPRTIRVRNSKEFNIKSLIKFKAENSQGDPKLFKKKINTNSGNIYLLIDGSGSMRNGRDKMVRNLTANIMRAIEEIPRINLKAYVYSGEFRNSDSLCIQEINNSSECEFITHDTDEYGTTPTHHAIDFISKRHENDSGKKLLIVITDGEPALYHESESGYGFKHLGMGKHLKNETKRACVELESKEFNLFGIGIDLRKNANGNFSEFDQCFRNEFVNIQTENDIKKHLISKMTEFVGLIR